jgi:hypothetical protein
MKTAIIAVLFLSGLSQIAKADTITLGSADCGTLRQCAVVPNNASVSVTALDAASQYGRVLVTIDDVTYDTGLWVVYPMGASFSNVRLIGSDGTSIQLSAVYTSYKTCNQVGRGQSCGTHWTLVSGSIAR